MKRMLFLYKAVPRWVILLIDLVIVCASFTLSYFIIKQFEFSEIIRGHFFLYTGLYTVIAATVFYIIDRKSTRLNSSHVKISYAVFCLKKKNIKRHNLCCSIF